ncbi:hypothetical protein ACFV2U_26730 [Streptomyces sp. NPDC059697]|uniref:hypothetical protein n=1 Tax=Streptomyces sp. NPDC059697 TaxID=3346912 RepID=UPI00369F3A51
MPDVRHLETIDDIDREAWDALAPGSCFYQSHAWLRGQERPEFAAPGYLTVEADGQLPAGTPHYDFPSENAPPLPDVAEGHTALRFGTRTGYHNEFLLPKDPGTAGEALDALVAGAAERAATLGFLAHLLVGRNAHRFHSVPRLHRGVGHDHHGERKPPPAASPRRRPTGR